MTQFNLQVTHNSAVVLTLETNDINMVSVDQLKLIKGKGLPEFKLQINHGGVLVVDLDTDDINEVETALFGFEYELTEMLTGGNDEHN